MRSRIFMPMGILAVQTAVCMIPLVCQEENLVHFSFFLGNAPGIFTLDYIDNPFWQGKTFLLNPHSIADYVHGDLRVNISQRVPVYGNLSINLNDVLLAHAL